MHYYSQQCKCGFVYIDLIYFCHGKSIPRKKKLCLLCTTSSVSERGHMDSENHSVVIRSIGLHSMKSTVSRLITLMGI